MKVNSMITALANEFRLSVFRTLIRAGSSWLPVGMIGDAIDVASSLVSFHMKESAHADMVISC
jgi:hypothetical protein